jgi:hypothetical protein
MPVVKLLQATWLILAATPLCLLAHRGLESMTVAAGTCYVLGWVLLVAARRRDPAGEKLRAFGGSTSARAALWVVLVMAQLAAFVLSASDLFVLLITVGTLAYFLWYWAPSGEAMARVCGLLMVAGGTIFLLAAVGEVFFRVPAIVARTGGTVLEQQRWTDANYDFLWQRNIYQLRSFHTETAKQTGTLRIIALGDSMTWGDKIPRTEDTWPYVLERTLNNRGQKTEVINLGQKGFSTVNEAEALERLGWRFDPDLVVLQFYVNDPLPSAPNFQAESTAWLFRTHHLSPLKHHELVKHSFLYAYMNERFERLQLSLFYSDGHRPLFADDFQGWADAQAAIETMAAETRRRGVPMLVVLFPHLVDLRPGAYPYENVHEKVAAVVARARLPLLDLRLPLAKINPDGRSWWALPWDAHPGVRAHALAGEMIAATLESRDLFDSNP